VPRAPAAAAIRAPIQARQEGITRCQQERSEIRARFSELIRNDHLRRGKTQAIRSGYRCEGKPRFRAFPRRSAWPRDLDRRRLSNPHLPHRRTVAFRGHPTACSARRGTRRAPGAGGSFRVRPRRMRRSRILNFTMTCPWKKRPRRDVSGVRADRQELDVRFRPESLPASRLG